MSVVAFEPIRVISPKEPATLVLHAVIVASIPSRMASSLITEVSNAFPLPLNLKHLKRVRPSKQSEQLDLILLATADANDTRAEEMLSMLPELISDLTRLHQLVPIIAQVPLYPPETREQWQEWGKIWPMLWKIPEKNSASAPPDLTEDEERYFHACMSQVLDLASGSSNAAIIVDPLAFSASGSDKDAWVVAKGLHSTAHPLAHAVMEAVAKASERDRRLWPMSSLEEKQLAASEEGSSSKRQRLDADPSPSPGPRPYMCTGYDIFIKREPCVMCAMALVHSRLSRVIYCYSDQEHGALGGRTKLHAQRSLNHHYHVYQLRCKSEV
jgi:tRNA-specific adenosine deaminase 3